MKIIDLTHPLVSGQKGFPGDPPVSINEHNSITRDRYNVSKIEMSSHSGTHMDAMRHVYEHGLSIADVPLEWLYGSAHLLKIPKARDEEITENDLKIHSDRITAGSRIIVYTGWQSHFDRSDYYDSYPGFSLSAVKFLVSRNIRMLGMDMPNLGKDWFEMHRLLLGPHKQVVIVESLTNLELLPDEFTFIGFPLPIHDGDGSPVRAVALLESE